MNNTETKDPECLKCGRLLIGYKPPSYAQTTLCSDCLPPPRTWKVNRLFVENEPTRWGVFTGEWGAPLIADVPLEANAKLIAAAPEMLEALQSLLNAIEAQQLDQYLTPNDPGEIDYLAPCEAAIAKATKE